MKVVSQLLSLVSLSPHPPNHVSLHLCFLFLEPPFASFASSKPQLLTGLCFFLSAFHPAFLSVSVSSFETVLLVLTSMFLDQSPNVCPGCLPSLVAPFNFLKHYSDHITMLRRSRGEQLSSEPLGLLSLADRPCLPSTPST